MKGLLLQDYYLMRKNLFISIGFILFMTLGMMIVTITDPATETAVTGGSNSLAGSCKMILYAFSVLFPALTTSCVTFNINNDKGSYQYMYMNSCPIKKNDYVFEKYILSYGIFALTLIFLGIFLLILYVAADYTPKAMDLSICFLIISFIFIFNNIELPLFMKFGANVVAALLIIIIFICSIGLLTAVIKLEELRLLDRVTEYFTKNGGILALIMLAIDIVVGALSYNIAKKI